MAVSATAVKNPNILIFYVDDLGWQDVQLNDIDAPCPYETPNIVKLAANGMNITQGYSPAPTCAPSRAGIITGRHPAKLGFTHAIVPGANRPRQPIEGMEIVSVERLSQAVDYCAGR